MTDFWESFHVNFYLLTEFLPEICWEEVAGEIIFKYFHFDVWPGVYLLDYGHILSNNIKANYYN